MSALRFLATLNAFHLSTLGPVDNTIFFAGEKLLDLFFLLFHEEAPMLIVALDSRAGV